MPCNWPGRVQEPNDRPHTRSGTAQSISAIGKARTAFRADRALAGLHIGPAVSGPVGTGLGRAQPPHLPGLGGRITAVRQRLRCCIQSSLPVSVPLLACLQTRRLGFQRASRRRGSGHTARAHSAPGVDGREGSDSRPGCARCGDARGRRITGFHERVAPQDARSDRQRSAGGRPFLVGGRTRLPGHRVDCARPAPPDHPDGGDGRFARRACHIVQTEPWATCSFVAADFRFSRRPVARPPQVGRALRNCRSTWVRRHLRVLGLPTLAPIRQPRLSVL